MPAFFTGGTGPGRARDRARVITDGTSVGCSFLGSDPSQVRGGVGAGFRSPCYHFPPRRHMASSGTAGDLAFGLRRLSRNEIKEGRVTSWRSALCLHMKGPHFLQGWGLFRGGAQRGSCDPRSPLRGALMRWSDGRKRLWGQALEPATS